MAVDFKKLDEDYVAALALELAKLPKIGLKQSVNRKVAGKVSISGNANRDKWIKSLRASGGRITNLILCPSASINADLIFKHGKFKSRSHAICHAIDHYAGVINDDVACNGDDTDPDSISVTLGLSVDEVNAMRTLAEEGETSHSELVGFALRLMQEQLNTSNHLKTSE